MKVFLDSSVILFGLEIENCNSAVILEALMESKFECVINNKVLREVRKYLQRRQNKNFAFLFETLLRKKCIICLRQEYESAMAKWEKDIKLKDLEHITTVKSLGINILVAYDRDFETFPEYTTPRKFAKMLGKKVFPTEY
ncbi:MAG: hypothetical protein COS08_03065 [Euryarchaeota archaeon CG01_land_8_20_14_3_00_38_12]|nr:MAG: hypothetical protein COS08_03065 [Euryarchaeota archaeon CG01_land_8_20_14_3_00_38_12]